MKNEHGYYNETVLDKFAEARTAALNELLNDESKRTVKISNSNTKMGAVASVSLLPFFTCPACCKNTCGAKCYAAKLANLRPSVLKAYAHNTALATYYPAEYWNGIRHAVQGLRFFRFHVSGDIINRAYFDALVSTAISAPHCDMLVFTKRFDVVNRWIMENGNLPKNLHVIFSGWTNLKPLNPYNLPESNVVPAGTEPDPTWKTCGGNCFNCACRGVGCWNLKNGETIAFRMH